MYSVEALSSGFPQLKTTPHSEKSISFELDRSHSYPEAALLPRRSERDGLGHWRWLPPLPFIGGRA